MPGRFQKRQHDHIYKFVAQRDGNWCLIGKVDNIIYKKKPELQSKLEIDHMDNDPLNWSPENLHLLCKYHNLDMRQLPVHEHIKLIRRYEIKNREIVSKLIGVEATKTVRELVDYRSGSPEMAANSYYETKFRSWILEEVSQSGFLVKKIAITAGAEISGCSTITAKRYLEKLTSPPGPLYEYKDETGTNVLAYKSMKKYEKD